MFHEPRTSWPTLVNNAGVSAFGPSADLDPDLYETMFAANDRAAFLLVAALAPGMAERGRGAIVNVSSMAGRIGMPGGAAYGATKAALESMTRAWAAEFGPSGVRVNAVAPGPVYTGTATPGRASIPRGTSIARPPRRSRHDRS